MRRSEPPIFGSSSSTRMRLEGIMWRTHSCVPRSHSCERTGRGVEMSLDTARKSACATSWPCAIQHSRKRDCFANMLQPAHPRHETLDAHPESRVRYAAELAQIHVPVERFARQVMFFQALQQQVQIVDALAAANDFAVAFGRDEIHAQRQFRT